MELLADRYELGDPLGHGRSTVYRATDTRLRRAVAIKRVQLLAGHEDVEQVRARALREAQATARLNNPATVTVYDVVEESGAIWLVMELVDGPSLAELVADDGPLPHDRAARLGLQVLTALEAAHLAGVVHRDVKPANVLVVEGDRAKLTDFGVATIRDESRVTLTGVVVGSPSYMAPEQATAGDVTAATDLWALGALLYFTVEGEPPFLAGNALATAAAVVHEPPRAAEREGPLTPIIGRLLSKEPAARPSAGAVRAALVRVGDARAASGTTAVFAAPMAAPEPAPTAASPAPPASPQTDDPPVVQPTVAAQPAAPVDEPPAESTEAAPVSPAPAAPAEPEDPVPEDPVSEDPVLAESPRRRTGPGRRVPLAAVAAVAAVVLLVAVLALRGRGDGGDDTAGGDAPSTTAAATDTTAPTGDSTTTTTAATTTTAPGALPAGWVPYRDPTGAYTIGHPPGWEVSPVAANRTDFRDPATGAFVRVEWTDTPGADAAGAWYELEPTFQARNSGYERLGISQVAYRDYPAALWEFRHGDGDVLHTGNLGFLAAGRGYALMLRTPESQWAASQPTFEQFKQSFQPA